MKGHQTALDGECLRLWPLQTIPPQTTDRTLTFGGRKLQLGLISETFTSCGNVGKAGNLSGLQFPDV